MDTRVKPEYDDVMGFRLIFNVGASRARLTHRQPKRFFAER